MAIRLGLDLGSNSVGSAWMDTQTGDMAFGVSIFPAGVEESDSKRGAPKNQKRREKRSQRRSIRRRADRKRRLRQVLTDAKLLPDDPETLAVLMEQDPWKLRRDGLDRALSPHEFGRVLVHLGQRRGALGIESDGENDDGKVKEAIEHAKKALKEHDARTFGELMAMLREERRHDTPKGKHYEDAIRNRADSFEFHADRALIRDEFNQLWDKQSAFGRDLAKMLTDVFRRELDDEQGNDNWRHRGALFGQRRTYWNTGTLGRCDLEPSDRCCPKADRTAQAFLVLETVNSIRIKAGDEDERPLSGEEREKVIAALRKQKTGSATTVRRALGINTKAAKATCKLNIERDSERDINTDTFYRDIVHGVFGEDQWTQFDENKKESVNRALLKFDPHDPKDEETLREGARSWWGLDAEAVERLIKVWQKRLNLDKPLKLSRRAIQNLMPYLKEGCGVTEARKRFAEDADSTATPEQRARYALTPNADVKKAIANIVGAQRAEALLRQRGMTSADRHFAEKHPHTLPPPPMMANPVVRKAIYEVRRHVNAYIRRFGRKPDRVIIEMARETKQSAVVRNRILSQNRNREKVRKSIIDEFNLSGETENQQRAAVDRVLLCRQQNGICPYTGECFSEWQAAKGEGCEVDHIIPRSRGGENAMTNRVLVERGSNREKANQTPRKWLDDEAFGQMLQRVRHMEKPQKDSYFRKNDFKRKWENLNRKITPEDEKKWLNSQLSDTAYASTQVADYLRSALYRDDPAGTQRIFFTKGRYTAMLRRDWQLHEDGALAVGKGKDRTDHRHHAIDAAVIALTSRAIIKDVAHQWAWQEECKTRTGHWPDRKPLPPPAPWKSVEELRRAVIGRVVGDRDHEGLVVCHRPVKRRIVGAYHEETLYGVADRDKNIFTLRIPIAKLTAKMLRPPKEVTDKQGRITLVDPELGKGGLVRDRELRRLLRNIINRAGFNALTVTDRQIQQLAKDNAFRMPSGVPIRTIKLLRKRNDPVIIGGNGRPLRVYVSGNNHHVEIVEDTKTGKWSGKTVRMWDAVQRVRPAKGTPKQPLVQKDHGPDKRFVMSLAIGETIFSRRQDRREEAPQYFVVFKLDKNRIHFKSNTDSRLASEQDSWSVGANDLKKLGPQPGTPPYKVRVSPLGDVERLPHD